MIFAQTDLTAAGLSNYKRRPSVANSVTKYPTPAVLPGGSSSSSSYSASASRPVPQKRETEKKKQQKIAPETKAKPTQRPEIKVPTFTTFKQFNRTASLSDLINEDEVVEVKPEVALKHRGHSKQIKVDNENLKLESAYSLASFDVCIPEPILPPTKSITVQACGPCPAYISGSGVFVRKFKFSMAIVN